MSGFCLIHDVGMIEQIIACRFSFLLSLVTQYSLVGLLIGYLKIIVCTLPILSYWITDRYATIFHFVQSTASLTLISISIYL